LSSPNAALLFPPPSIVVSARRLSPISARAPGISACELQSAEGKIFAADIEPDMVRYLGERARREHLNNLLPVQASSDAALGNTA
jgi:hypothetical protein